MVRVKDRPKIGVGVLVYKENQIIILQRKGAHGSGTWCPPGGHLEFGETPQETAVRETFEETGVHIVNCKIVGVTNDVMLAEGKHYLTFFVKANYLSGELINKEPEKISDARWVKIEDIP